MTDKLICPFCGAEMLVETNITPTLPDNMSCPNEACVLYDWFPESLFWQFQRIPVLQKKLDKAMECMSGLVSILGDTGLSAQLVSSVKIANIIKRTIKEIEDIKEE